MKKENLGKKIACGVILLIIILGAIIMIYMNGTDKNNDAGIKNETNMTTNEVVDKETPQEAPLMGPNDTTQAGVVEEVN